MAEDLEPLRRTMDLDAALYLAKLRDIIREHEREGEAAQAAAARADAAAQRSGAVVDGVNRRAAQGARERAGAEEQAAQQAGQSWAQFVSARLADYTRIEGGHKAAMQRIGAEWTAYKNAGLSAAKAVQEGVQQSSTAGADALGRFRQQGGQSLTSLAAMAREFEQAMRDATDPGERARWAALAAEVRQTEQAMERAASAAHGFQQASRGSRYGAVGREAVNVVQDLRYGNLMGAGQSVGALRGAMGAAGMGTGTALAAGTAVAAVAAVGVAAAKATQEGAAFESMMVEVKRTTGMASAELDALASSLLDMQRQMGVSKEDLAGIAETAGSLDIKGQENIETFTRVVAMFSSATGVAASESATNLGSVSKAFNEPIGNVERLGSTIDQLADDTGANAEQILQALSKVGASGRQAGLSSVEIAGLSSVMIEAGVNAETAGTSFRNGLTRMVTEAEKIAPVAQMTEEAWVEAFGKDPLAALTTYLEKVRELDSASQTAHLKDVFGDENIVAFATLTQNLDRAKAVLDAANGAYADGTRLQRSYAEAMDTTNAQWAIFKGTVDSYLTASGEPLNDLLKETLGTLNDLIGATDETAEGLARIGEASEQATKIEALWKEYKTLYEKQNRTTEETARLHAVTEALIGLVPDASAGYDTAGNHLGFYTTKIESATARLREFIVEQRRAAAVSGLNEVDKGLAGVRDYDTITSPNAGFMSRLSAAARQMWSRPTHADPNNPFVYDNARNHREGRQAAQERAVDGVLQMLSAQPAMKFSDFARDIMGRGYSHTQAVNVWMEAMRRRDSNRPASATQEEDGGSGTLPPDPAKKPKKTDAERALEREAERIKNEMEARGERMDQVKDELDIFNRVIGANEQMAVSEQAVADQLTQVTAARRAYADALAATDDPDGARLMGAKTSLDAHEAAYERLARASGEYQRALEAQVQAEERVAALTRAQDEQKALLATATGEHKAQIEGEIALIGRQIAAAREQANEAKTYAASVAVSEAATRRFSGTLLELARQQPFAKLMEDLGGVERALEQGIRPEQVGQASGLYDRIQGAAKLLRKATARVALYEGSGTPEQQQTAREAQRVAVAGLNAALADVLDQIKALDLTPPLRRFLEEAVRGMRDLSNESGEALVRWAEEAADTPAQRLANEATQSNFALRQEQVDALERASATYDETAQLADAWASVASGLGASAQRAAQLFGGLSSVLRSLGQVKAMQAQVAAQRLEYDRLMEASRTATGDEAVKLARQADAVKAAMPSGLAQAMPVIGAAVTGVNLVVGLVSGWHERREQERENRAEADVALAEAADALKDAARQMLEAARVGADVRGEDWAAAQAAMGRLSGGVGRDEVARAGAYGDLSRAGFGAAATSAQALSEWLDKNGLEAYSARQVSDKLLFGSNQEIQALIASLAARGIVLPPELLADIDAWRRVMQQSREEFGEWGKSVAGASARMEFSQRNLGLSEAEGLQVFLDQISKIEKLPASLAALVQKAQALDASTPEGQAALKALVEPIMKAIADGTFDWSQIEASGLSQEDFIRILETIFGAAGGASEGYSRQTQIAGTITEVQTNELLFYQAEQLRVLRGIEAILRTEWQDVLPRVPAVGDPQAYLSAYMATPTISTGTGDGGMGGGASVTVNVRAEHRIEEIMEQIDKELRRSGLF